MKNVLTVGLALVVASGAFASDALVQADGQAKKDLDAALAQLSSERQKIQAEKVPLNEELSRLENELATLKRTYDETTRAQDTHALELGNLEAATKLRQDETTYIANLLDEYTRGFEGSLHVSEVPRFSGAIDAAKNARDDADLTTTQKLDKQVHVLRVSLDRLLDLVGGTRYPGKAVDAQGMIAEGEFAAVGPVVLFAAASGTPAGLAIAQAGSALAAIRGLGKDSDAGVAQIASTGEGTLPLDPSRGGALKELMHRGSLIGYFKKGGPIMYPLLVVSVLALTVILERLFFLAREKNSRQPKVIEEILAAVAVGDVNKAIRAGEGTTDYVARALTYALKHREKSLSNALLRSGANEVHRYNRGISILDTCITAAPLLGLLGTVTGMMGSFGMLGGAELSAPAQITGGIAEALIATAFGLTIAISCLIPMSYLHGKANGARHELEDVSTHLEILMKPILDAEAAQREERVLDFLAERAMEQSRAQAAAAAAGA
jgi:biopolymer transport protein ExbB